MKEHISEEFLSILRGVIISYCKKCVVKFDSLVVSETKCSKSVGRATEIDGFIESGEVGLSGPMLCALRKWQLTEPSIILNGDVYIVDSLNEI
jgi:hypothetical protein